MLFTLLIAYFLAGPTVDFEWVSPTSHDFGELQKGRPAKCAFENTSADAPMLIDVVRTTCGCTAVEHSEGPILPGETGRIVIEHDAAHRGYFIKKIKVFFHGQRRAEVLTVEGEVI